MFCQPVCLGDGPTTKILNNYRTEHRGVENAFSSVPAQCIDDGECGR